jgi:hypothetical protein
MSQDRAILRLLPTLAAALAVGDFPTAELNYSGFIQLSPDEIYLQTTNITGGTTMVNPSVYLVDCQGNVVQDITLLTGVEQFTDINGDDQFAYEFAPLETDYHSKPLFLKFIDSAAFNNVWYSNGFTLTNDKLANTVRVDYKTVGYSDNLNADLEFYNSIRFVGFFHDLDDESTVKQYRQITSGNEISTDPLITERNAYKLEYANAWNYRRLNRLFTADIIYIDGVRCTNKPFLKKGERLDNSNMFVSDFTASMNVEETYTPDYQILTPFQPILQFVPSGTYTQNQFLTQTSGGQIYLVFNQTIATITNDMTIEVYKDGVLLDTLEASTGEISIGVPKTLFVFALDAFSGEDITGEYYFVIAAGQVRSITGEYWSGYVEGDWTYEIVENGEYDPSEYDNNGYLT